MSSFTDSWSSPRRAGRQSLLTSGVVPCGTSVMVGSGLHPPVPMKVWVNILAVVMMAGAVVFVELGCGKEPLDWATLEDVRLVQAASGHHQVGRPLASPEASVNRLSCLALGRTEGSGSGP
jgi:hypothetical protein